MKSKLMTWAVSATTGLGLVSTWSAAASAATINVNGSSCSFDQAVQALNSQAQVGGCAAGNGSNDTIQIPAGTFSFAVNGTDYINRPVTISGAGASSTNLSNSLLRSNGWNYALFVTPDPVNVKLATVVTIENLTMTGPGNQVGVIALAQTDVDYPLQLNAAVTLGGVTITQFGGGAEVNTAFSAASSQLTINNSTLNNTAGGGNHNEFMDNAALTNSGTVTITGSTISNNEAQSIVGFDTTAGLMNYPGAVATISGSTFTYNISVAGGAVYNEGTLTVTGSTFENNVANNGAGAFLQDEGALTLSTSTFYNNSTGGFGGAVLFWAPYAGSPSTVTMNFVTIAFNTSGGGYAGGIYEATSTSNGPISLTLNDCIVAENSAGSGSFPDISGDLHNYGRNLIGSSAGVVNPSNETIFNSNPMFGSISHVDNFPDTLPLLVGSPAIDQEPGPFGGLYTLDERGFPRPLDGNNDGTVAWDLGAFEYDPWQIEYLAVAAKSSNTYSVVTDSNYSNQEGGLFQATATNNYVTFAVPIPTGGGTYDVKVRAKYANNDGKYQLSTATSVNGTYSNLGTAQDLYSSSTTYREVNIGNVTFSSGGNKYFKFLVTGKDSTSSGYNLTLDYLKLTKQ